MTSTPKVLIAGAAVIATIAALTGCSAGSTTNGKLTLSVVSLIPGSDKAAFSAFNARVKEFEKANPNINVKSQEYEWKGDTFAAKLAGGTLPDVYTVPFTDVQTLIQNGQAADITSDFDKLGYAKKFNQNVLDVSSRNGKVYGIPTAAYGNALQYNRDLFKQAGLDPNSPPTTWDEVRADAKAIAEKTGKTGFAQMTKSNTGGWQLAVATYARGGRLETVKNGKTTITADNAGTKKALEYLKELRWKDNSMGSDFLQDWGSMNQAFGAGQIGMYTSGSDIYTNLIQAQNMPPKQYGLTTLPLEGSNSGVLTGGTVAAVNVKADDAHKAAAVKWINFYYMEKLVDQKAAVADAKALVANKQPVGVPALPLFDKATLDTANGWVKSYINVPQDQVQYFLDGIYNQKVLPEPQAHTQELYAALDSVVQAVLTDQNADVDALLTKVDTDVQQLVDAD